MLGFPSSFVFRENDLPICRHIYTEWFYPWRDLMKLYCNRYSKASNMEMGCPPWKLLLAWKSSKFGRVKNTHFHSLAKYIRSRKTATLYRKTDRAQSQGMAYSCMLSNAGFTADSAKASIFEDLNTLRDLLLRFLHIVWSSREGLQL